MYKSYTHAYIYIYHVRTHTHIHIYTHTHTKCTYERTQSTSETTARQRLRGKPNLTPRSSALLPVCITTARCPGHIRLSALVRSRSTQFIVHASSQLGRGPPKGGHFSAIWAGSQSSSTENRLSKSVAKLIWMQGPGILPWISKLFLLIFRKYELEVA